MKTKKRKEKEDVMKVFQEGSKDLVKVSLIIGAGLVGLAGVKGITKTISS